MSTQTARHVEMRVRDNWFVAPGAARVQVAAGANRTRTVQYTDDFRAGGWCRLADLVARPTNRIESVFDPNWVSRRFYRLVAPVRP